MADRAIDISKEYPNKKLIIHFVQPHFPFIGDKGSQIEHPGWPERAKAGKPAEDTLLDSRQTVWERLENGQINKEEVWSAYKENLEITLPHVNRIIKEVKGKTVVSSDHGNALGEWNIYGHPCGRYHPSVVTVPWFQPPYDERRNITRETVIDDEEFDDRDIKKKLADLGYIDSNYE